MKKQTEHSKNFSLRRKLKALRKIQHTSYVEWRDLRQSAIKFKTRMVDMELERAGLSHLTGQARRDARYEISARLGAIVLAEAASGDGPAPAKQ